MTGTEYQRKAMRTAQGLTEWDLLLNGVRMGGVLQALRTVWPLGKEEPQRCDSGVERHDFGEKEGARKWLTEAM